MFLFADLVGQRRADQEQADSEMGQDHRGLAAARALAAHVAYATAVVAEAAGHDPERPGHAPDAPGTGSGQEVLPRVLRINAHFHTVPMGILVSLRQGMSKSTTKLPFHPDIPGFR